MTILLLALSILAQQDCPNGKCPIPSTRGQRAAYSTDSIPSSGSYAQIVVRIANNVGHSTYFGSGVILRRNGLVLTCRHIFRAKNGKNRIGKITVWRSDGRSWNAELVGLDEQDDLAAVAIDGDPGNIPEIWYALEQPKQATLIGFPHGGNHASATTGNYSRSESVFYDFPAAQGVSGGPLFCRGRLVLGGVLWGSTAEDCALTSIHDVKRFLYSPACLNLFAGGRRGPITQINNNTPAPSTVLPEPSPLPPATPPPPVAAPVVVPPVVPPVPPVALKGDKGDTGATGATGSAGKNGLDGQPGKDGANGANGKDGISPSPAQVIAALQSAVKPITFNIVGPDGTVSSQQVYPLRTNIGDVVTINVQTTAPVLTPGK